MKINNDSKRDFRSIMNNIAVEKDPEKNQAWPGIKPLPLRLKYIIVEANI